MGLNVWAGQDGLAVWTRQVGLTVWALHVNRTVCRTAYVVAQALRWLLFSLVVRLHEQ